MSEHPAPTAASSQPGRTAPRRRLDTAQVVDAAARYADAHGLAATTLSALARELDIKTPSLYRHVDSLAALVEAVATLALHELQATLSAAASGRSGGPAVHAVARAYRTYAHAHPGRYAATTAFAAAAGHDAYRAAGDAVLAVLRATLRHWPLTDDQRIDAIRGLRASLHGFVELERCAGFGLARDVDTSFAALVDTHIAGLDRIAPPPPS